MSDGQVRQEHQVGFADRCIGTSFSETVRQKKHAERHGRRRQQQQQQQQLQTVGARQTPGLPDSIEKKEVPKKVRDRTHKKAERA